MDALLFPRKRKYKTFKIKIMPPFIIYLLKANIALTVFYLVYRFGLRRLTYYHLNRVFLLIGIGFSALYPLIHFDAFFQHHQKVAITVTHYALDLQAIPIMYQPDTFNLWRVLGIIFWIGVGGMTLRFLMQLISLLHIHSQSQKGVLLKENVNIIQKPILPFSFFKNIYIHPGSYTKKELKTILAHEKVHAKGWHSIDVLAGEINHIFYWFNPGAWLMKTAIRENLEFITDQKLLNSGIDTKQYQYNLLNAIQKSPKLSLVNSFNFSHLKQRIMMMNKNKSSRWSLFRYLFFLPVAAVLVFAFTSSNTIGSSNVSVSPFTKIDSLPKDYKAFLKRNPSIRGLRWSTLKKGKPSIVIIDFKNGRSEKVHLNNKEEIKNARNKFGKFPTSAPPPELLHKSLANDTAIRRHLRGYKDKEHPYTPPKIAIGGKWEKGVTVKVSHVVYEINDQKVAKKDFEEKVDPSDIYSIHVFKDSADLVDFPKGTTGLIKIYTKAYHKNHPEKVPDIKAKAKDTSQPQVFTFVQQMPAFPGGEQALKTYLNKNIQYPKEAKTRGIKATIVVQFVVRKDGKLTNIKTVGQKKGYGLEKEALRVVKKMPKWKPGKQDGKTVRVSYSLPIRFQPDKKKNADLHPPKP